ncbi:MAG: glycerol-3-phosphate dehydrogenase/oxidase [Azoarcus sp.]|nr:glycerol-3-phosphate dehydrogenase/oxidase [Azoarcus sp.]
MSGMATGGVAERARLALLARLSEPRQWDVVVIGGGATGLGCAVDAAARGYSVLVVDAEDFAKGTSSRATKLIHGGVRYLAQGNLPLVREALLERSRLLANAPHLVRPMRFVVPAYRFSDKPMLAAGLGLYDLLAGRHGIARSRLLDIPRTIAALPTVRPSGLRGGIAYWDAQFDDARLALALARTVSDLGGLAVNHCAATGLVVEAGRVRGVALRDAETGAAFRVAARAVINASGVWADGVRRFAQPRAASLLSPSQGVHVVVGQAFLPGNDALLVPKTDDGRVLFMIPWQGRVLLGTTDTTRTDLPLEPRPLPGEIDFILETAARYLVRAPTRADVLSVFVGLRPLIGGGDSSLTRQLSREHLVDVSAQGLISVLGGKWTTYRMMAEDAIDTAQSVAGLLRRDAASAGLRLHGAPAVDEGDVYGTDRTAVDALPGAGRALLEGLSLTEAEVRYAARAEFARGVEDVLARRHRVLFFDAALAVQAAPAVAAILAQELGRDEDWAAAEIARFETLASGYICDACA